MVKMGCFDERCAITNVAVHHGDEVFFMYADRNRFYGGRWPSTSYDLRGEIYSMRNEIERGFRFPWDVGKTQEELLADRGIRLAWGTYNDYGWIEEIERDRGIGDENVLTAFVHSSVVEAICAEKGIDLDDKVSVLYELLVFSHFCRLSFHTELGGEQYGTTEELKYQRKRVELITQVLDTKEKDPESLFNPLGYGTEEAYEAYDQDQDAAE